MIYLFNRLSNSVLWLLLSSIITLGLINNYSNFCSLAQTQNILFKRTKILAWQELILPDGIPLQPNRDIGFVSIFIQVENTQEKNQILLIKNIEIRNASDAKKQPFYFTSQVIQLRPLENSQQVFHLTNKTGYLGKDKVKALITYQVNDATGTIESAAVEVQRN